MEFSQLMRLTQQRSQGAPRGPKLPQFPQTRHENTRLYCPRPRWGSVPHSPRPPSWNLWVLLLKGRIEGREKRGKGEKRGRLRRGEKTKKEKRKGNRRKGKGRGGDRRPPIHISGLATGLTTG